MANVMLTTVNNEYNPFKHFDEWYSRDCELARQENRPTCCGYLARLMREDSDISDKEFEEVFESYVDDICALNLSGTFIKVNEDQAEKLA